MNRKFFVCSVGQPGKGYDSENLDRIIKNKAFILHETTTQKGVYDTINPGDLLILKFRNKLIAYGLSTGNFQEKFAGWNLYSSVDRWYFFDESKKENGVSHYGLQWETTAGGQYGTVKEVSLDYGFSKIKEINSGSNLFNAIRLEVMEKNKKRKVEKIIELLDYKKQIILQGPPGTGKTKLAKEVAMVIADPEKIDAIKKTNDFFRDFNPEDPEIIKKRKKIDSLTEEFNKLFPKDELKNLTFEHYYSPFSNISFYHWIKDKLKHLNFARFGDGHSLVDWDDGKRKSYFNNSPVLAKAKNKDEQMKILAESISRLIQEEDLSAVGGIFDIPLSYQILCSYYPEKYFPISHKSFTKQCLDLLGIRPVNDSLMDINQQLSIFLENKNKELNIEVRNYEFMHFLWKNFYTSKSPDMLKGDYKLIQFHPSYTYEDFVRGIIVETKSGHPKYRVVNKVMADFAQKALDNPTANYVLIIDEINRANLPSVLGELIYALEYRYDENNRDQTTIESMYSLKSDEEDEAGDMRLSLPINLFIIGTMNSADRSVGHIDYAIRRRFAFVDVLPDEGVIDEANKNESVRNKATILFKEVSRLFDEGPGSHLAPDFKKKDVQLGHSYFLAETMEQLELKLEYEIKPLLEEYLKDGILLESAKDIIDNLK